MFYIPNMHRIGFKSCGKHGHASFVVLVEGATVRSQVRVGIKKSDHMFDQEERELE